MPKKPIDLTGRKFRKLTVIHCNLPPRNRILARCECGKEIKTRSFDLLHGRTSSCGNTLCCTRSENLLNMKFGFLTVQSLSTVKNNRGELIWICKCDCGKIRRVKSYNLQNGLVKSCGCKRDWLKSEKLSKPIEDVLLTSLFCRYKNGAKYRKLDFLLNKEQFKMFIFKKCFYCGSEPFADFIVKSIFGDKICKYNGIDRVDSNKGYLLDNCVTCCKICNIAKSNYSFKDFNDWINRLVNFKISQ